MQLSDMKIIITGAGGGMGAHFAGRIVEAGGHVAACDLNEEGLEALADSCASGPGKLHYQRCDVASEEAIGTFIDWAHEAMQYRDRIYAIEEGDRLGYGYAYD